MTNDSCLSNTLRIPVLRPNFEMSGWRLVYHANGAGIIMHEIGEKCFANFKMVLNAMQVSAIMHSKREVRSTEAVSTIRAKPEILSEAHVRSSRPSTVENLGVLHKDGPTFSELKQTF